MKNTRSDGERLDQRGNQRWENPTLEPRIGGRRGQIPADRTPRVPKLKAAVLGRLSRAGGRRARDVPSPRAYSRRCVVKARYVKMTPYGQKAAQLHLAYIEREGVEADGSRGRLYDASGELERAPFAEPLPGEQRQFRFILSPEDGAQLDLREYTRQLMLQMEKDLGRPLVWAAVNHYNTDNPHVHVIVRGVDRDGHDLRIPRNYIQQGLRDRASQLATKELGPRNEFDIVRQLEKEVGAERRTSIDRKLEALLGQDGKLERRALQQLGRRWQPLANERLVTLERLALARRTGSRGWRLVPDWSKRLRALGERGDIIKRLHQAMKADPLSYRVYEADSSPGPVEGIIRRKGLHDELVGDFFAVVETAGGYAYYVSVDPATAERVREGDLVRVEAKTDSWLKPTDRVIAKVAALNGGVYNPTAHRAQLANAPATVRGQELDAGKVMEVNLRRLARLAEYKLVDEQADGTWKVPTDLVEKLLDREKTHPRQRVYVEPIPMGLEEQTSYRGPTWLDQQAAAGGVRAPYGFGAQVSRATALRERELATQFRPSLPGPPVPPALPSPTRMQQLEELERRSLGQRLAAGGGWTFQPEPQPLSGRLFACETAPSGRSYACVVDERTRQIGIVSSDPGTARNLMGRSVDIATDAQGRLVLRQQTRSRGG